VKPAETTGTRWEDILALAYGVMRLPPDAFWAMTPREFDAAARPYLPSASTFTARRDLAALMRAFPDTDRG
jgi:uncharacterized phage protein (TIGR02216 family)